MNSVSPHPPPFPYVKWNERLFLSRVCSKPWTTRDSRAPSCQSKCDKILPSVWYVFEHKTQLFVQGGFWKGEGGKHELFFFFFFSYPFNVLQNEDCVYCALGGVLTISESRFRSVWRYSATPLLSEHQQQGPQRKRQPSWLFSKTFWHVRASLASLCCEDGSPAVDKDLSVPQLQPPIKTVWCGYSLLTHNWKLTFSKLASDWWLVVIVVLIICWLGIKSRR